MRKTVATLAVLGTVLAATPAYAAGPLDNDALRAALEARYDAMQQATDKRDGAALGKFLAPDFASVTLDNQTKGRDQMIHDVGVLPPKKQESTTSVFIHDVRQVKDKAYVDETYRLDKTNTGQNGKSRKWRLNTNVSDTWTLVGDEWLLEKSVANSANIFINDQHVAHQVRGKKMRLDKTFREKMKLKTAAPPAPGSSCGGTPPGQGPMSKASNSCGP
jgi:hypothetical protein